MLVSFDSLPEHARIWVYQSHKSLSSSDKDSIKQKLTAFCKSWEAHQKPLQSSFKIVDDYFILLAVDESSQQATGCSIDTSVEVIKSISQELSIDLFDRLRVATRTEGQIKLVPLNELKASLSEGDYPEDLCIINTMVQNIGQYKSSWILPLEASWLNRFVPVS